MNTIDQSIQDIIEVNISEIIDLDGMTLSERMEIMDNLQKIVINRSMVELINTLDEEQLKEYRKLTEKNNANSYEFLAQAVPNYKEIIASQALILKYEMQKKKELLSKTLDEKDELNNSK